MTRAQEINVLMANGGTKAEAERTLKNGTVVYENPQDWVDDFNRSDCGKAEIINGRAHIDGIPAVDAIMVEYEGHEYLVEYVH